MEMVKTFSTSTRIKIPQILENSQNTCRGFSVADDQLPKIPRLFSRHDFTLNIIYGTGFISSSSSD